MPGSIYGAGIFVLTYDAAEIVTQMRHDDLPVALNVFRAFFSLLMLIVNYVMQIMMLIWSASCARWRDHAELAPCKTSEAASSIERSEFAGHVPLHVNTYTYTYLHNIQIDSLGSERSEGSERSGLVGHVPVHTKFIYLNSNNIQLLAYA